jgi:hypothetical protein
VPAKTPFKVVQRIIDLRFQGYSVKEIANIVSPVERTVSRKIDDFTKRCREVGVLNAVKEYELDVDDLFEVAEWKRASGLSFPEIGQGIKAAEAAKNLGYQVEKIGKVMELLVDGLEAKGENPLEFALKASRLVKASRQLDSSYEEAVKSHEALVEDIKKHKKEEKSAREKKERAQAELNQQLKETDTQLDTLRQYLETREKLIEYNIHLGEAERLATLLDNVNDFMGNAEKLADHYKTTVDAQEYTEELLSKKTQLEEEVNQLSKQENDLIESIAQKERHVKAAEKLAAEDIIPEAAGVIADTVRDIAVKNGVPKTEAMNKLTADLREFYDPVLGMESRLKTLEPRVEASTKRLEDLEVVRLRHEEEHSADILAIKNLRALNQKGVGNDDIVKYNQILRENNLDPAKLGREIKRMEGLPEAVRKVQEELMSLTEQKTMLTGDVEILQDKKRKLELTTQRIQEGLTDDIEKLAVEFRGIVNELDSRILSPETGLKKQATNLMVEALAEIRITLNSQQKNFQSRLETFDDNIERASERVKTLTQNSYEAGKLIGTLSDLDTVTKLIQGKLINPLDANIAVLALTTAIMDYLRRNNYNQSIVRMNHFLDAYRSESLVQL